jgi:DNA polymerase (family 10)
MEKLKYKSNQRSADVARRLRYIIDYHFLIGIDDISNFNYAYELAVKWNNEAYNLVFGNNDNKLALDMKLKLRKMFSGLRIDEEIELDKINNFNKAFFTYCGNILDDNTLINFNIFGPVSFYRAYLFFKEFRQIFDRYVERSKFYDFLFFYFKFSKKPIGKVLKSYEKLKKNLSSIEPVGSLLRFEELIYPLELISTSDFDNENFNLNGFKCIYKTKFYVLLYDELNQLEVKLHLIDSKNFKLQKWFLTGSLMHIDIFIHLAKRKFNNFRIFKDGIFINGVRIVIDDEKDIYRKCDFNYVPPELRCGSTELFMDKDDLKTVNFTDIKSDLHIHTNYSDGSHSIEELCEFYIAKGFQHIVLTDHSVSLTQGRGLNIEKLMEKNDLIDRLNEKFKNFKIFKGVEVDILHDGSLDYPDWILKDLDFVVASVHQDYSDNESVMTMRFKKAIMNPYVHMIGHISGRLVGFFPIYNINLSSLLKLASEYKTIIEINGNPARLDIDVSSIKIYKEKFKNLYAVNTDLHNIGQYDVRFFCSVMAARKSYLKKSEIVNSLSTTEFEDLINTIRTEKILKNGYI